MDQNDAKRWTNLGASLLIILAGGTVYAFGAYSEALKRKLHLTQAQLGLACFMRQPGELSRDGGLLLRPLWCCRLRKIRRNTHRVGLRAPVAAVRLLRE